MADGTPLSTSALVPASELAHTLVLRAAPNGIRYGSFGDIRIARSELDRVVAAVPAALVPALGTRAFYFIPLAMADPESSSRSDKHRGASDRTLISPAYTPELSDEAICHRVVQVAANPNNRDGEPAHEGIFISAALLRDTFALAFEFFINVGHLFVGETGVPETFATLAWSQALADTRGETSQDAHESRAAALADRAHPDEKAKSEFLDSAFSDALAIYLLSLAVDFDYSELREREYPLLAPAALAERLRLIAHLFPAGPGYEFSIRYRRRA